MDEKKIFIGIGAVIAVLAIVAVFSTGSGDDAEEAAKAAQAETAAALAGLGERLDGLESRLEDVAASAAGAVSSETLDGLRADLAEAAEAAKSEASALAGRVEGLETELSEQVGNLQSEIGAAAEAARAAMENLVMPDPATDDSDESSSEAAAPADDDSAAAADAPAAAPGSAAGDGTETGVGQTALFADGAVRAFVSMVSDGAARVSINGTMRTLSAGEALTVPAGDDYCRITLDAADGSRAALSALCGDDLPPPAGLSAGETALFQDGALRVFVSRVTDDGARLSVNGDARTLAAGAAAMAMAGDTECHVRLSTVDRGHATVSALCGDDNPVSPAVAPGAATVLGDGAARIFVAAIDGDAVRFAVNGQTVVSGAAGDSVGAGDNCAVTVEEVADGGARFSHACQ